MNKTMVLLDAMPPPGDPVTVAALGRKTGIGRKLVANKIGRLESRGLVERCARGTYRLTGAGVVARRAGTASKPGPKRSRTGRTSPRNDTLRARLWRALRKLGKATIPDLLTLAAAGHERAANGNALKYLRTLERAGYVTRLAKRERGTAPTSPGFVRWVLIPDRDTGPRAPVMHSTKDALFDPNTGAEIPLEARHGKAAHAL